jgi:hypothetical protein
MSKPGLSANPLPPEIALTPPARRAVANHYHERAAAIDHLDFAIAGLKR